MLVIVAIIVMEDKCIIGLCENEDINVHKHSQDEAFNG